MPLNLRTIDVLLTNGQTMQARAEGNNAAWCCPCGESLPLIGTTRHGAGDTQCPHCKRVFRTIPESDKKGARAVEVREIAAGSAT